MTIVLDKDRPSPSQVEGRVLVPLRREQIAALLDGAICSIPPAWTGEQHDDYALLDYALLNPELP